MCHVHSTFLNQHYYNFQCSELMERWQVNPSFQEINIYTYMYVSARVGLLSNALILSCSQRVIIILVDHITIYQVKVQDKRKSIGVQKNQLKEIVQKREIWRKSGDTRINLHVKSKMEHLRILRQGHAIKEPREIRLIYNKCCRKRVVFVSHIRWTSRRCKNSNYLNRINRKL